MPSLTIEWRRDVSALDSIAEEWRALENAVRTRTHLSTYDFLGTWYRHYAGDYGGLPLIGLARRSGRLVGLAPLTERRGSVGRIPVRRVEFAPSDVPAGEFLVEEGCPEIITAFLESLSNSTKFDLICLDGVDPASDQLQTLTNAARARRMAVRTDDHAFAMVDLRRGYDAYWKGLSGHYRRNLNQKARKITAEGFAVEGVIAGEPASNLENLIHRLIVINEASYKLEGRPLAKIHRDFLADVVRQLAARGTLSLPILTIGGHDAAFILGVVERQCFYDITLAYDEAFARVSPGAFLMQRMLEALAAVGVHTVVSHGAHDYKKHWATTFVPQKRLFLFAPSARASATRFVRFGLEPLWRRLGALRAEHATP
jgi:CelD/BcsL family acetyltransferase involved in cellulose biosynthesis